LDTDLFAGKEENNPPVRHDLYLPLHAYTWDVASAVHKGK
jgi:hypothetical protein